MRLICLSQCVKHTHPRGSRIFVSKDDLSREHLSLADRPGILECVILSTCIRFEIYAVVRGDADFPGLLADYLRNSRGITTDANDGSFSTMEGTEAVRHLFSVVCGLDSRIIGEKQIVGQVKHAYHTALEIGCTGPVLNKLFQKGLHLSKRVRTRTGIDKGVCSAASLAVRLLLKRHGGLSSKRVLILGAGQMGKLVGLQLASKGCTHICFASRSPEGARAIAEHCSADWVPFNRFFETLHGCDILVTATGAPHEIVGYGAIARAMEKREGRELCVIDLADPPDVDPRISSLEKVSLFTIRCIDDLASETRINRAAAAREAWSMIEEAVRDCDLLKVTNAHVMACMNRASH